MASSATLLRPIACRDLLGRRSATPPLGRWRRWSAPRRRGFFVGPQPAAGSRADDSSAPYEMSLERALKLLGVKSGASFDEILRAKNAIAASCQDNPEAIAQIESAYDILLMQSLSERRAGKVASSRIRYADVKPIRRSKSGPPMPQWMKNFVSIQTPSSHDLLVQAGTFGSLIVFMFVGGSSGAYSGQDVPGLILAIGFGASLYFLTKKDRNLGKAALLTVGGLVVGVVIGSTVENFLQVDVVPFFGIRSPVVIISEFVLISQLTGSLYLR